MAEPTGRRALRSEFSDEQWQLVTELADHPNRLLVTATPETGEAYAQVAHEVIFQRWDKLRKWTEAEQEFLVWRRGLETDRRRWEGVPAGAKSKALLMGHARSEAQRWLDARSGDLSGVNREFIELSLKRVRTWWMQAIGLVLSAGLVAAIGFAAPDQVKEAYLDWPGPLNRTLAKVRLALSPPRSFKDCAGCPEMVVVPAGEFMMGSLDTEGGRERDEGPRHRVTIAKPFAVSRFEVTFEEWDACFDGGGCQHRPPNEWGRGRHPVIHVNWIHAKQYVAWLSKQTGKPYRLLSESEWEYAARAGSDTVYSWGNRIRIGNANCYGCGSEWDNRQAAPVGRFPANAFGLHDMHGNVWEWVEDCWPRSYDGAPADGSAWTAGDCNARVVRGGSWKTDPQYLRAAYRDRNTPAGRNSGLGFRVKRTLVP
jgi:formylglycine-generating enzyme required for sulfatase activity